MNDNEPRSLKPLDYHFSHRSAGEDWDVAGIVSILLALGSVPWFIFAVYQAVDVFYSPFPNTAASTRWSLAAWGGSLLLLLGGLYGGIVGRRRSLIEPTLSTAGIVLSCCGIVAWVALLLALR